MSKFAFKHTLISDKFWLNFTFLLIIQNLILPQRASLAGVGSQITTGCCLRHSQVDKAASIQSIRNWLWHHTSLIYNKHLTIADGGQTGHKICTWFYFSKS